MQKELINDITSIPDKNFFTVKCSFYSIIVFVSICGFTVLYNDQWKYHKSLIYETLYRHAWNRNIVAENVTTDSHKLLIWVAAYDSLDKRDQYVLYHLTMAKSICETPSHNSSVRLFIATCSQTWKTNIHLCELKNRNSNNIIPITKPNFLSDFKIIEHFKWSCVEFIIGFYKTDLKLALPFQHRKYFRQHIDEFDWFWFTEDDLLYDNRTYWKLVEDTSFAFNTLSSTQTNDLLSLYAHKGKKPNISPFGRYFFLPTLMRFEKPVHYQNNSTMQLTDNLDRWLLSDMALISQPLIEALIFYNEQWWFQPSNSHSGYYLLPRKHMHAIIRTKSWLSQSRKTHREWVSSFWLLNFGYIRVASITNFDQYLVHHASNKYYDHYFNILKSSTIIRALGFEYKESHFLPAMNLNNSHLLNYTDNHNYDIASCFPLSFSPISERPHEGIPSCIKLLNTNG